MVTAQWRAAEAVQVPDSPTSAGCRVMTMVVMKDAVVAANAALQFESLEFYFSCVHFLFIITIIIIIIIIIILFYFALYF